MSPTIDLDDHFQFWTEEINDIGADGNLPAKANALNLFAPKLAPKLYFHLRLVFAKISCTFVCHIKSPPTPPPLRGRGGWGVLQAITLNNLPQHDSTEKQPAEQAVGFEFGEAVMRVVDF